jgi:hypothetical protein
MHIRHKICAYRHGLDDVLEKRVSIIKSANIDFGLAIHLTLSRDIIDRTRCHGSSSR